MRCAIILRMFVMGTRSPGYGAGAGTGRGGAAAAAGGWDEEGAGLLGADDWRSMKDMMSCFEMRPPRPVPEIWDRLMPCSRAILRTSGEERASSSSPDS